MSMTPCPPFFQSLNVWLPDWKEPVQRTLVSEDHLSDSRAAEATTILNVEPGGYCPCRARLVSGWCGSVTICSHTAAVRPRDRVLGSKVGRLASTSTSPFVVSSATTAPASSPRRDSAI